MTLESKSEADLWIQIWEDAYCQLKEITQQYAEYVPIWSIKYIFICIYVSHKHVRLT